MTLLSVLLFFSSAVSSQRCKFNFEKVILTEVPKCSDSEYRLVYQDEFNLDTVDRGTWRKSYGVVRDFDFEVTKYWIIYENAFTQDGNLIMRADRPDSPITGTFVSDFSTNPYTETTDQFKYTGAEMWSRDSFLYGRFEIRCRIPEGKGVYPAFWLYGGHTARELDIFEFPTLFDWRGCFDPDRTGSVVSTNTWNEYDYLAPLYHCAEEYESGIDFSVDFHTFSADWEPHRIQFYVDKKLFRTVYLYYKPDGQPVYNCSDLVTGQVYFLNKAFPRDYMQIVLSTAVWNGKSEPNHTNSFPDDLEIDYVRVYQKHPTGSKKHIRLYPNPAADSAHLMISDLLLSSAYYWLTGLDGKPIFPKTPVRSNHTVLPVNGLSPGIYFLFFSQELLGKTQVLKLVVK